MVVKCVVLGCGVYSNDENIGFYSIPTVHKRTDVKTRTMMQQRRSEWLKVLMLKDPPPHVRVCGRHFVSGQPAALIDVHSTPSLHLSNTRANQIAHQFDVPDRKKAKLQTENLMVFPKLLLLYRHRLPTALVPHRYSFRPTVIR